MSLYFVAENLNMWKNKLTTFAFEQLGAICQKAF